MFNASPPGGDRGAQGPFFSYLKFENSFRGSEEDVRKEQSRYLPYFEKCTKVLDIGCGRGEFLEHMKELAIAEAYGIDLDDEMLERCREKKLDALKEEALAHLQRLPDSHLDGIFISHVVEHLAPRNFLLLLAEASRVLRSGGALVAETLNPQSLFAYGPFFMDLSHVYPIHPLTFKFLMEEQGFRSLEFLYRQYLPPEFLVLNTLEPSAHPTALEKAYSETVRKLQTIIDCSFANFIYAIKGSKA